MGLLIRNVPLVGHLLIFEMGLTIQNHGIAEFRLINIVVVFQLLVSCGENRIKTAYFARARLLVLWYRCSRDWWVGHFSSKIPISKRKSTPVFLKRGYILIQSLVATLDHYLFFFWSLFFVFLSLCCRPSI